MQRVEVFIPAGKNFPPKFFTLFFPSRFLENLLQARYFFLPYLIFP